MSPSDAGYIFLPWMRRGLGASISSDDTGPRLKVDLRLRIAGRVEDEWPKKSVALYGPGDILGFDPRVITRTEPPPNVGEFEPNYFPFIEFAEPDFPWRFTASGEGENGDLRPWISLIVLPTDEIRGEGQYRDSHVPWIRVGTKHLPDPTFAARWAHVQLTEDADELTDTDTVADRIRSALDSQPEKIVSRLLCARRLQAGIKYSAFVVPTFELGVFAAKTGTAGTEGSAQTLAWEKDDSREFVELPCYYRWEFRTGRRGDFEHLVRRLEPRRLTGLGLYEVDCRMPGYRLSGPESLGFESALKSIDTQFSEWGKDAAESPGGNDDEFREGLATLLNLAGGCASSDGEDCTPKVVPPLYGRWHKAENKVNNEGQDWFDELNLDPRHRWAAGLGAEVVRKQQEQLMASAWDQLGDIKEANEILRRAQFGREVSTKAEARLNKLSTGEYLQATAPVLPLVTTADGKTASVAAQIQSTQIGGAALDPAFRRQTRTRGMLRKRQIVMQPDRETPSTPNGDVVARMIAPRQEQAKLAIVSKRIPAKGISISITGSTGQSFAKDESTTTKRALAPIVPDHSGETGGPPGNCNGLELTISRKIESELPEDEEIHVLKGSWLDPLKLAQKEASDENGDESSEGIDLDDVLASVKDQLSPAKTVVDNAYRQIRFEGDMATLDLIAADPEFLQPMSEALEEASQQYLLAGIEKVPQNTVALLEANRRFIEAFMCGLNHEFSRELLWREYPTDQRGSYFRHFWENYAQVADIAPLPKWNSALGDNRPRTAPASASSLVLLFRGDLLNRYPNAAIYLLRGEQRLYPDFSMLLKPDIACVGFNLSVEDAIDDGWYLVLEERISEARFGLDESASGTEESCANLHWNDSGVPAVGGVSVNENGYLDLESEGAKMEACALNSASAIASYTLQNPVRVVLSAKQMIPRVGAIEGMVRSTLGQPIAGATVAVADKSVETDGEGRFSLVNLPLGENGITVSHPDHEPHELVASLSVDGPTEIDFALVPLPGTVAGTVIDHLGNGLKGVRVYYAAGAEMLTDAEGAFEFADVPVGNHTITAQRRGFRTQDKRVSVSARTTVEIAFALAPTTGTINGRVADRDGRGLDNASIEVNGTSTASRAGDGRYEISSIQTGEYVATARHPDYQPQERPVMVETDRVSEVLFALMPLPGAIAGTVTDHLGKGLVGVKIFYAASAEMRTGTGGKFEFTAVPVGEHTITAEYSGYTTAQTRVSVSARRTAMITLPLTPTTGTITGNVTDQTGRGLGKASISVDGKSMGSSASDGRYTFNAVPVGNHVVEAKIKGYQSQQRSILVEGGMVATVPSFKLAWLPGGVKGIVRKSEFKSGRRQISAAVAAKVMLGTYSTTTDARGIFRFEKIPAGNYKFSVSYPPCSASKAPTQVTVRGGGETESITLITLNCPVTTPIFSWLRNRNLRAK